MQPSAVTGEALFQFHIDTLQTLTVQFQCKIQVCCRDDLLNKLRSILQNNCNRESSKSSYKSQTFSQNQINTTMNKIGGTKW